MTETRHGVGASLETFPLSTPCLTALSSNTRSSMRCSFYRLRAQSVRRTIQAADPKRAESYVESVWRRW